ncbi:MAG: DUF3108 domain-containing protein, partial [Geminicoccales bacterium]
EPTDYRFDFEVETVGLVKTITKYRAEASIAGKRERFGSLAPVTYSYRSKTRKKTQSALVEFDPNTGDVVGLEIKKRGEPRGTDVPEALQRDVIDPLTAFLELRELVAKAHAGGKNRLLAAVFDGRHRYDVQATLTSSERVRIAGRSWPALRVVLDIVPRAGFDDDDLEDLENLGADDDELRFAVLFSDDGQMLPLKASTLDSSVSGTISLLEDCSGSAGCRMAAR